MKAAFMKDVEQFVAFVMVEEQTLAVEEFQSVVFGRIVGCGERDAAAGAGGTGVHLDSRCGHDADINDFASGSK